MSPLETLFYVLSMLCVGFLEELIFRGFLFRMMEKDNLKSAIIVSSLTFGIGHIVNLVYGSGMSLAENLGQILFAVLVGFALVLIFYRGGSLIPCIAFHSANNALGAFARDTGIKPRTEMLVNFLLFALVGGYALYLIKTLPKKVQDAC